MFEQVTSEGATTDQTRASLADAIAAQIRAISTASNVGVALVGADRAIIWANPALANLIGRTADELVGASFEDVTHTDDLRFDARLVDLLFTGTLDTYQVRKRLVHRAGRAVPVLLNANVLRGSDNQILFALASVELASAGLDEPAEARKPLAQAAASAHDDAAAPGGDEVDRIRRAMLD